jgi:hypothetical protein
MEHLMMCGNKTDQCPNCRKYVRRAIFAYHYENGCANPDDPTTDGGTYQTAQHSGKFCDSLLLILNCLVERARVTIKCEYCKQNYEQTDRKTHRVKTMKTSLFLSKKFCFSDFTDCRRTVFII